MPLQKTKHVYTQYRKHQHDYKKKQKKTKNRSSDIRKGRPSRYRWGTKNPGLMINLNK